VALLGLPKPEWPLVSVEIVTYQGPFSNSSMTISTFWQG
jgi:hypothetical protein